MNQKFKDKVFFNHYNRLNLTLDKLGDCIGVSKSYLNVLKNSDPKKENRNLTSAKLSRLLLIVSQKDTTLIDKVNSKIKTNEAFYELNFHTNINNHFFLDLLLSFLELSNLSKNFIASATTPEDISEIEIAKNENRLNHLNDESVIPEYEIWTLSDILGEKMSSIAKETANNIFHYGINYRFFVPIHDEINWKIAAKNIKDEFNLKNKNTFWSNHELFDFIHFYGIAEVAFITRLRIYDALSETPKGNYSVGGFKKEEIKLIDLVDIIPVRNILKKIVDIEKLYNIVKNDNESLGYKIKKHDLKKNNI
ncbi:MAG: hypothetical protein ACOCWG_05060 [bacterium]